MKKLMKGVALFTVLAPTALSVSAAENTVGGVINGNLQDDAEMRVNVKAGELGLAFTNNIDPESGQVSKPSKAEVDFGTVDLGVKTMQK